MKTYQKTKGQGTNVKFRTPDGQSENNQINKANNSIAYKPNNKFNICNKLIRLMNEEIKRKEERNERRKVQRRSNSCSLLKNSINTCSRNTQNRKSPLEYHSE